MNEERCVMCGEPIPEGRMVCPQCEYKEPSFETRKYLMLLDRFRDMSKFVELVSKCKEDVVVKSGNFAVNAKSILGLLSLDLTNPVCVEFYGDIPFDITEEMKNFIIN